MRKNGTGREWIGGRLRMPSYVMEGEPYRPEIILWLELPDDLIVGSALLDPQAPPVSIDEVLVQAMARPLAGPPRRPTRLRVASEALAAELRAVASELEIVIAPTPELDAVLAPMAGPMPMPGEAASYLEGGRIAVATVEKLFRAAERLYRLAPWQVASDGQVLRLDIPRLALRGACVSIIGALGESTGVLIFPSVDGYEGFLEFSKLRPVFKNPRLSLLHLFYPPYKPRHRRMLDLLIKYKR